MYKITIEQTKKESITTYGDWVRLDDEEVARDKIWTDEGNEPKTRIKEIHGRSPNVTKEVEVTTEIYKQSVDELDLNKVIFAVNGLGDDK